MKDAHIILRVDAEDKKFLQCIAKRNKVSLSNYILMAVMNKAKKDKKQV